jgi:hypothetical protein
MFIAQAAGPEKIPKSIICRFVWFTLRHSVINGRVKESTSDKIYTTILAVLQCNQGPVL